MLHCCKVPMIAFAMNRALSKILVCTQNTTRQINIAANDRPNIKIRILIFLTDFKVLRVMRFCEIHENQRKYVRHSFTEFETIFPISVCNVFPVKNINI